MLKAGSKPAPYAGKESGMKTSSILLVIAFLILGTLGCQQVQKPELNGQGPLAVRVARGTDVPEYHAPAERWRVQHQEALNRGDFSQKECMLCHNPRTGCNQCHQYAGVKQISVPEAALFWPAHGK
jgi:hypothetical protein